MSRIIRAAVLPLLFPIALLAQRQLRDTVAYTTAAVRLRSEPAMDARALATLPGAAPLHVQSCSKGWCSVVAGSAVGYVAEEFLTLEAPQGAAAAGR